MFGRTLRLIQYFMCANSEGSGDIARMRRLAWAFAGRPCDKYHNLMSWLIQSKSKSCMTQTQDGKGLRRHKVNHTSGKPRWQLFPSIWPPGYPKQNERNVDDTQKAAEQRQLELTTTEANLLNKLSV